MLMNDVKGRWEDKVTAMSCPYGGGGVVDLTPPDGSGWMLMQTHVVRTMGSGNSNGRLEDTYRNKSMCYYTNDLVAVWRKFVPDLPEHKDAGTF